MSGIDGERRLADLIRTEAPIAAPRALAVMVAVTRQLIKNGTTERCGRLSATDVLLRSDGSVAFSDEATNATAPPGDEDDTGAAVGRLLFEILVGRPPLDRSDAFEPAVRNVLSSSTCSLLARSFSDAPGQWPDVQEWADELHQVAGGQAPPLPASERRALRRRTALFIAALALLAVASVAVLLAAPGWWNAATEDSSATPTTATSTT